MFFVEKVDGTVLSVNAQHKVNSGADIIFYNHSNHGHWRDGEQKPRSEGGEWVEGDVVEPAFEVARFFVGDVRKTKRDNW